MKQHFNASRHLVAIVLAIFVISAIPAHNSNVGATSLLPSNPTNDCSGSGYMRQIDLTQTMQRSDDGVAGPYALGFTINYFGENFSEVYISNNGKLTFGGSSSAYTPTGMGGLSLPTIAPFFADVDTRATGSPNLIYFGQVTVDGHPAFAVHWAEVGYYSQKIDKANDFMAIIINRSDRATNDWDFEFNYSEIQWETGDASGGSGGLGGTSAAIGYADGTPGTNDFQAYGSLVPGSFLDSNPTTGAVHTSLNSPNCGQWIFSVTSGSPINSPTAYDFSAIDNNAVNYPCIPKYPVANFEVPLLVDIDVIFHVANPELVDRVYLRYSKGGQEYNSITLSLEALATDIPGQYSYNFFIPDAGNTIQKLLGLFFPQIKARLGIPGTMILPPNLLSDNNIQTDYGVIKGIVLVGKDGVDYYSEYPDEYIVKTINNRPVENLISFGGLRIRCSGFYIQALSPVDLLVIDDDGRRVGNTPTGVVIENPNSYYSGPEVEHEFIIIENPDPGTKFNISVTGTGNGTYDLIYGYIGTDSYLVQSSSYETQEIVIGQADTYETTIPTPTFVDVPFSYWAWSWIERLYAVGITAGCGNGSYCPEYSVTRAQMAIFLERGINGSTFIPPTGTGTVFADVPLTYWAVDWVEKLYADGITGGCGISPQVYCPDDSVTRAQMAIFLLRSKYGPAYTPPPATGIFEDVPTTYWAANWIEQLYTEGVTGGCGTSPLTFCPDSAVTRAQMAVFLVRTFNLP